MSWKTLALVFTFTLLLVFCNGVALATSVPEHSPFSYAEQTWSMRDGLPEQVVQAFAQTSDRYLWIGTTGGLLRFDGARFTLFNRDNTPAFSDNNIFCLTVSRDNTLWIGSEGGGLASYRDGVFRSFANKDGLTNSFVRIVYQDNAGETWVGTDNGLFRLDGDRLERVDGDERVPMLAVHAIFQDKAGGLWVGGSRLLRIAGNQVQEFRFEGESSQNRVKSIVQTSDGDIWVGTVAGLHRMRNGAATFEIVHDVVGTVRSLRQTSDSTLWIGTIGHGLYADRGGHLSRMSAPKQLPSNTILNLFEDIEQNIWVGTQAGMLRLSTTPVKTVSLPDASDSDAETVYQDRTGDVWIAAANLFRFRNGAVAPYHFPGINGVRIRNIFRDRDGALWIGTEGQGLYRQIADGGIVHYTTASGLVNNFVRAFLQGRDGSVWIATDEGVSRWNGSGFKNYQVRDGLCYFSTRSLLEDNEDNIWIGTDRGVSLLRGNTFAEHPVVEALKREKVWAIHQDPQGALWFGTRTGGLYRWKSGKLSHFTTANGLASNSIYEMIEDPKGTIWISGPTGISEVSRHELDMAADDSSQRITLTLYGISEGLEAIQMCGGEKPAGLLTSNGEVWFPSSRGPMRIRIDQPRSAELAPAVVDQVIADGLQITPSPEVLLGPDTAKLELHYGVVQLRSQERVRFRYRLEGFDRDWSETTAERVAHYTNLPAGQYKFRVAAFEMNNPQEISETSLEILQRPHFYQTIWFLSLCVFSLAAATWSIHKFHVSQLRARFQAVLNERTRLAREMHDTLIQGCVSVSALLEAHLSLGSREADAKEDLMTCARTQLRTTIDEAREAVWNLRQKSTVVRSLGPFFASMAEQVQREFGTPVEYVITGEPFEFQRDTIHEVLMVLREAIYNAVRHGHPSHVQIAANFELDECELKVVDDGIGFDPEMLPTPQLGHYGLVGMRERIQRIGGRLAVNSKTGVGTEIVLYVPKKALLTPEDENSQIRL